MVIKKRVEIEKVIGKGGHVGADLEADKSEWTNFTLRIKSSMSKEIDEALKETVGISKTGWILQAIQEKLRRGSGQD